MAHADEPLHADGVARWFAQSADLAGMVLIDDSLRTKRRRIRREYLRSGLIGVADVFAWRIYHRLRFGRTSAATRRELLWRLRQAPPLSPATPVLRTSSPNTAAVAEFLRSARPDVMIALAKHILKPEIFSVPAHGTFVFHPGICPEYRNAHGCFWALARGDADRVGMTLLRIDEGIDTGPVLGHYSLPRERWSSSPLALQHQVVLENLPALLQRLQQVVAGEAVPVDVSGHQSASWGQPRLTAWLSRNRAAGVATP
jgi:folate-dependent phosphoribosylglycinamide formyltransferase PurN